MSIKRGPKKVLGNSLSPSSLEPRWSKRPKRPLFGTNRDVLMERSAE
jgi:hypothetical protein